MNPHPLVQKLPVKQPPATAAAAAPPPPNSAFFTMATLYVGDLHPETNERDIADAFFQVVPFASLKLCRDRLAHKSLCYAYVNFFSVSDAAWAMSCLNHTYLRGKQMRIMWSQKDPTIRKTGLGNLFVKNIHPSITSAGLHGLFSQFGAILSCKIVEEYGKSKGFGFVQFVSEFSALSALSALHGTLIEGMELSVSKFVKRGDRMQNSGAKEFSNLYVKNLDDDVTEDQLKRMFQRHGKVCTISIVKDEAQKSRSYGLVQFASQEEVKKAMEALNGSQIGPKVLFVERTLVAERKEAIEAAQPLTCNYQTQPQKCSKVYVGNLDASIDTSDLELIFHAYGKITSAKVIVYQNGVSRGFGFVCFSSPEEAKEAIDSVNGTNVRGRSLIVDFARHKTEQYRQSPTVQYLQGNYTSNKDVHNESYHTPKDSLTYYDHMLHGPPLSASHLRSQQQAGIPVGTLYPFGVQKQFGNRSSYVWQRSPKQNVIKELAFQPNPVKSEYYLSPSEHSPQPPMDMKAYQRWKIKEIHDSAGASSKGSTENNLLLAAASSTESFNKYSDKLIQPSNESIQAGHENITGMLMGADNYDIQNSKHSQTFRVKVESDL